MRNTFTFGNLTSSTYGVFISGRGTFNAPARAYEMISIPGRDGDLTGIEKRLENILVTYPAFIMANFSSNMEGLRSHLLSLIGYQKLTDTYHTGEYRKGVYRGGLEPDVISNNKAGQFDISFECMPQRWLTSGDTPTSFTAAGTISNPTRFTSKPLIRVYGTGSVGIGAHTITISAANEYTDIDCEIMEAYKGTTNCNGNVSFTNNKFPVLEPGSNGVTLTGVTKVTITPRWYVL